MKKILLLITVSIILAGCGNGLPDGYELTMAMKRGDVEFVENALKKGLSPDFSGTDNIPMLIFAARYNNEKIVTLLLDKGANINKKDYSGETPVMRAANRGHLDMVKFLHSKGADMHVRDNFGWNILLATVRGTGSTEVIDYLLKNGVDINSKDNQDNNALMWAAGDTKLKTAEFLIKKGIDINWVNKSGATALDWLETVQLYKLSPKQKADHQVLLKIFKKHNAQRGWVNKKKPD